VQRLLALLVACLALVAVACGDLTEPYAAKVNGTRISVEDLDRELRVILDNDKVREVMEQQLQMPAQGNGKGTLNTALVANQLTLRVLYELVHQEVARRDIEFTAAQRQQAETAATQQFEDPALFRQLPERYRNEIVRNALEFIGLQEDVNREDEPTEAEVRAFYEQNAERYTGRCVSHILVESREEIDQLRTQIVGGASFAEVARESSIDEGSGRDGGFLLCQPAGQPLDGIVEPFKSTAEALPVGQISEPVQTQFGWHLITVSEGRPFESVEAEIRQQLAGQGGQQRLQVLIRGLVDKAKIEINPRYGRFVKDEPPFGRIVPPEAPKVGVTTTTSPIPGILEQGDPGNPPPGG
jgi:parvulin-like peptidyl-prolyl isomerase